MQKKICAIAATIGSLYAPWSLATESGAQSNQLDLFATLSSLVFVIALILFLAWLLKRMQIPAFSQQADLSVVRQIVVGGKERIAIVQAGEEQFLVGVTPHSIQLISKLEQPVSTSTTAKTPFSAQLNQLLQKDHNKQKNHE
ncbi:flagellar biosynthetic protein FliO [Vibrio sp. 10N.286.49.B3]|uniref:flagellar biosynthetic protein FliO n=1 Tax=Vibrio sp. 10N.286.49.B3 TaxID=1880855 RepID=UPI000C865AD8|nr:flagellar biosynthetic protein FliO [Vibrio sp. 10N.286.49.B3]PMH41032.1 flagellar biosynthetic protein FliO [Vibrio sp. 10N.286.49.B3]